MKKRAGKFCPRCGAPAHATDAYCMHCGYSFSVKKSKKISLKSIIILIIILVIGGIILQVFFNQSIIPKELIDIFKNMTSATSNVSTGTAG